VGAWLDDYVAVVRDIAREADRVAPRMRERPGDVVVNVHGYALAAYEAFLRRQYADGRPRLLALSMNPARNGAVQTGIAFTDAPTARGLVPGFDRLVRRPPALVTERVEMSGQKLQAWARAEFGGVEGLYERVLFPIACPIAVLRGPNRLNVPLPALRGRARQAADAFYEANAPRLVRAARARGLLFLGDYAARRWKRLAASSPDLARLPVAVTHHPAARITNARKYSDWTRALSSLERRAAQTTWA
jgi:hypothetical protein